MALWRHGTSVRLAEVAARYKVTADRLSNHMKFLRVVTDGQPTAIAAVDERRALYLRQQARRSGAPTWSRKACSA